MAEKITRTHEERDALLSKVFDSTLQTKDIEITEAGTTEITPDEGFFALKKVNLNVNVQGGSGGNGGVGGAEIGLIYVTKESIFAALGTPMPEDMLQSEFKEVINQLAALLSIRALKRASGATYDIEQGVSDAIYEGWLTFANWTSAALYLDTPMLIHDKWTKTWAIFGATTLEEAKTMIAQIFPNQLTEEEFLS